MPSLNDVLQDTYVFIASKEGVLDQFETGESIVPGRPSPVEGGPVTQAIWHWTYETGTSLTKVKDVECWSEMMMEFHSGAPASIAWLTVLRDLEFGPIHVTLPNDRLELPLTPEFFVRGFVLRRGKNPGDPNSWWPLAADVDASFLTVFAFDVTGKASTDKPDTVPSSVLDSDAFMPAPPGAAGKVQVPAGQTGVVDLEPRHRICVCLSLVCTKQRSDFEPAGIVGMGRLVPHVMMISNRKTDRLEAQIKLTRPPSSGYFGTFENPNPPRIMNHGDMDTKMGALVVTDTNDFRSVDQGGALFSLPINVPYWDLIFDYFRIGVPDGTIVKANVPLTATTRDSRGERTFSGLAEVLDYSKLESRVSKVKGLLLATPLGLIPTLIGSIPADILEAMLSRASLRIAASSEFGFGSLRDLLFGGDIEPGDLLPRKVLKVRKVQRQADFDSIHLAPRMVADKLIAEDPAMADPKWQLSSIAMAPFCEHDCLHTHWRWGENYAALPMKPVVANTIPLGGFAPSTDPKFKGVGKPYQVIGHTMAPLNQKVEVEFNAAGTGFTYLVEAIDAEPGVWQVANHHGSAYALAISGKAVVTFAATGIASRGLDRIAELYWNMRFQATTTKGPLERLTYDDGNLQTVING